MGVHMSRELGWTPAVWGREGRCSRPGFPPAPGAAGDALVGDASTAPARAETRCDGFASGRPDPAPSPSTGLQLLTRLSCPPPRWRSASYQMEGGKQGSQAINFPSRHRSVHQRRSQPLGTDDSLVFMVLLKGLRCLSGVFSYYINI